MPSSIRAGDGCVLVLKGPRQGCKTIRDGAGIDWGQLKAPAWEPTTPSVVCWWRRGRFVLCDHEFGDSCTRTSRHAYGSVPHARQFRNVF